MKAMLSQPMAGKTEEEIVATREKAIQALEEKGYEIVNTLFTDEWYSQEKMEERGVVQIPLCFLAKSLENMSLCHAAYFCKGWEKARGCKIEHDAAVAYGLALMPGAIPSIAPGINVRSSPGSPELHWSAFPASGLIPAFSFGMARPLPGCDLIEGRAGFQVPVLSAAYAGRLLVLFCGRPRRLIAPPASSRRTF